MLDNKIKCCKCNNIALWFYAPSSSEEDAFYCEEHVPRGCSCNQYHLSEFFDIDNNSNYIFWNKNLNSFTNEQTSESAYYEPVDEQGRRFPCCEYWYDEDGWDVDENEE